MKRYTALGWFAPQAMTTVSLVMKRCTALGLFTSQAMTTVSLVMKRCTGLGWFTYITCYGNCIAGNETLHCACIIYVSWGNDRKYNSQRQQKLQCRKEVFFRAPKYNTRFDVSGQFICQSSYFCRQDSAIYARTEPENITEAIYESTSCQCVCRLRQRNKRCSTAS